MTQLSWMPRGTAIVALTCAIACQRPARHASATTFVIDSAWARAAMDTGATTVAYVSVTNGSTVPVTITGFYSDAAQSVTLHESMADDHMMMHMTPKSDTTLAPGSNLVMHPNGLHLMVTGITRPLPAGSVIRVTMRLSNGTIMSTTVHVRAPE